MNRVKIIAEIGINHNGSIELAKKMIALAAVSGCDYVKFQKRNPDKAVPEEQKDKMRDTPWGRIKYIDYKHKIEFSEKEYDIIDDFCKSLNIGWFASVWDTDSVDFMGKYKTDGNVIMKIPSALITNIELVKYARSKCDILLVSTGMSNEDEIVSVVKMGNPDVIFHTNSTYPTPVNEINLGYIKWLKEKYNDKEIGYSGHEYGLVTTFSSVAFGAQWVERHITTDREMWGSDQSVSIEPSGLIKLVKGIRDIEKATGGYEPRKCFGSELEKRKSLRGC